MAFELKRVLKALLFVSPGSISVKDIQTVFTRFHEENNGGGRADAETPPEEEVDEAAAADASEVPSLVTGSQIREAMDEIAGELEARNEVYRLQETHQGWRLVTSPDCADWVRLFRNQPRPVKLSHSALETLAIIAYRQPVVRAEIEKIRGVSVDSALNRLQERELIKIVGRADLPGRPLQYGTTEAFLEFVGIKSLDELPASDVLSAREIDAWLRRANEADQKVDDQVLGLDTESGDEEADLELAPEAPGTDDADAGGAQAAGAVPVADGDEDRAAGEGEDPARPDEAAGEDANRNSETVS
ncbi:MAG: SMC-Scp complex subunit ScpB [Verrucomicrobia bacterium]|nr:MAG: SMC-Scp complex subunit ScpB [Verrucomicrobiota bacterium]